MSKIAALERRDAFIADIVAVCKKHRVMIEPDGSDLSGEETIDAMDVQFCESNDCGDPYDFDVSLVDIEDEIRMAVWPIVHGV